MEYKWPRKENFFEKGVKGELTLPNYKTYYKTYYSRQCGTGIKIDKKISRREESQEIGAYTHWQLISNKGTKAI